MDRGAVSRVILRCFVIVAALAAALRAVIPVGFMLAFDDGGLSIVRCTGMFQGADHAAMGHGADHSAGHNEHGGGNHDPAPSDEAPQASAACPYSIASVAAIDLPQAPLIPGAAGKADFAPSATTLHRAHGARAFLARGPPRLF